MIKEMGLEERTEYITFSRHATKEFIRLAPKGTPVYYLEGDLNPQELKDMGCAGPDYHSLSSKTSRMDQRMSRPWHEG